MIISSKAFGVVSSTMSESVFSIYLTLVDNIRKLNPLQQYTLLKHIEQEYENEADTPLGEFIELFVEIMMYVQDESIHQDIQDLLDVAELNEEMLALVGNSINDLIVV